MKVREKIYLDFGRKTVPVIVYAKQNDNETREIEIVPLYKSQSYAIEEGVTPRLHLTKPDGHCVFNDVTLEDGNIIVTLTEQILAAEGMCIADIGLYKGEQLLSSQLFYIDVNKSALNTDKVESSNEFGALKELLAEISNLYFDDSNGKISLSDYVKKTLTIAGVSLNKDIDVETLCKALGVFPFARSTSSLASENIGQLEYLNNGLSTQKGLHLRIYEDSRVQILTVEDNVVSEADENTPVNKVLSAPGVVNIVNNAVYPVLMGSTVPTADTLGKVGQLYLYTTYNGIKYTYRLYCCTSIRDEKRIWVCIYNNENNGNFITTVSSVDETSTDEQAVGAKLFYDTVGKVNEALEAML